MTAGLAHWGRVDEESGRSEDGAEDSSITALGSDMLVKAAAVAIDPGEVLAGRYQIEAVLGRGGSGIVLRAFDRVARVLVAVKILKPELATDPRWIERFSRELRLGRTIQHPNVCRVFDIGQADGHWFITMELATNGTLRDQLGSAAKARPIADRLADVRAVVAGLAAIHGAGIVHRDVKPDNFLRLADGRLVLSDFGLATNPTDAPAVSILVGTPHYMSPEVVIGEIATPRSDVWSAGVVVHEILFGTRPSRRAADRESRRPTTAASVEDALWLVCARALADEPEDRPEDASELLTLVDAAIAGKRPRRGRRARGHGRTIPWGATTLAVGLAIAVSAKHLTSPVEASSTGVRHAAPVSVAGRPADWSVGSQVIAKIEGRVHCTSMLPGGEAVRVVWGSPRRAEDLDVVGGRRVPSPIAPETYEADCPQLSPSGRQLLYTRVPQGGSPEILRADADGANATVLTHGTSPIWLPNGEEFVFDVDASHVGIFSVPTMSTSLLSSDTGQTRQRLYAKAVSASGDLVAVLYLGDTLNRNLEIYSMPDLGAVASRELPSSVTDIQFDGNELFYGDSFLNGSFVRFDWRTDSATRAGYVPDRSLHSVLATSATGRVLVSRRVQNDVWRFDGDRPPLRLTDDGHDYAASWAPSGDVLIGRHLDDDRYVIDLRHADGRFERLTNGPADCVPSFSRDGSSWVYADYGAKAIVACTGKACVPVRHEAALPSWPRLSPDGAKIAYTAVTGTPHLFVIDRSGENRRDLGAITFECPPVWTSSSSLWGFTGAGKERHWDEIDVASGNRTGRSKPATFFNADSGECGLEREPADSPFHERASVVAREDWELRRVAQLAR
ncbi:MAG TPA: protein kinase [Polyangia bacterium]|nr:protein kinase [Polyangia bacterium]